MVSELPPALLRPSIPRPAISPRYLRRETTGAPRIKPLATATRGLEDFSALRSDLSGYLRWLGVPRQHLDELTQDVFLTAHARRETFRGESSTRTWLRGIALRIVLNWRRRLRTRKTYERFFDLDHGEADMSEGPDARSAFDDLFAKELCRHISVALSSQPPQAQRLWSLVVLDELPIAAASRRVDLTANQGYELFIETRRQVQRALRATERVGFGKDRP